MSDVPDGQVWLPLAEAAQHLGLSRHQLRRRIRAGTIANRQVQGPHGPAYEVSLDPDATVMSVSRHPDVRNGDATVTVTPPLTELVNLLRETQRQNVELAGMVGSLQQRLLYTEDRVRMLEAPRADRPEIAPRSPLDDAPDLTPLDRPMRARAWWRVWAR